MRVFTLTTLIFFLGIVTSIYGQKGRPNPNKPTTIPSASGSCPFVLSIEDKSPSAVCSELLKTLVAVSDACTDTTMVSYSWSSSVGGVFSTSRTTTFNLPEFIISTPLTITISATEGVETKTASYTFIVKPRPSRPTLSPIGTILLCDNNPITLTSSGCTGGSTPIWSNGNAGLSTIVVPAIGGNYFKMACQKDGCVSDSTAAVSLVTGVITSAPTVTNRIICEGTTITAGYGLQANIPNCGGGVTGTYNYTGGVVGYDDGYRSSGSVDPTINIPTSSNIVKKVSVSVTWRKQAGGFQNDCGTGNTLSYPYHSETQLRIKSPSGKIITLVNTQTYGGWDNPTVTTVFEDAATPINFYSPPVSGTFAPAQPLSGFIGENPSGTWTLLPYDAVWRDPLCVSGFSLTFTQDTQPGTVTWWDAPTGGNLLYTGSEYIPTNTASGVQTYYVQGQCVNSCPSIRTPATLTINARPAAPIASTNIAEVSGIRNICGGESITLTATGCANTETVKWSSNYYGANFATGATYTFTPSFSTSSDISQTFMAICENTNLCKSVNSNTITINVKRKPTTPNIFGPGATVCSNTNVTLTASACSGGTLGWTDGRSGSSISFPITVPVNIKVACTINGCTSDSSAVYSITPIPKPASPTVNASQVQAICIGGSVTLTANGCGTGTVKWTGGLIGASIVLTPIISKSYRASCLGTNGCASDSSAVLNIVVLPKTKPIITGPAFVCDPTTVTLTATGCGGTNESIMWRDQSVGLTLTENISQTKSFRAVCIRNGYCVSDSSDIFTVQYRTKPAQPTITPPANSIVCQANSITLTASACTGGTLNWTGGLTGNSIVYSTVGTKSFKVACTINGCTSDSSAVQSVTIKPKPGTPTISSSGNIVCEPQSITLTASACLGGTLGWTGGLAGQSIVVTSVGLKSFKVACTINGCTSDSSLVNSIQIKPKPAQPTIAPPANSTVCQPNSITLTGSACTGGTLNWTGGLTGNSIVYSTVGTKSFKVACTINGCTSDSSAVQTVTIKPKPGIPTISSSGNIVCEPQSITLTASACLGGTLGWTGGLAGQSIVVTSVGLKSFKVACTINGCTSDSSLVNSIQIKPKPAQPTIAPPANSTVCQPNSITLTGSACTGGTLNWTGGLSGNSIIYSTIGTKSFKVACTINGCTSDSSAVQTVTIKPKPGIPTITSSGNIVCEPQSITLTASACLGGTLGWTGGLAGQSIVVTSVGLKSFKVACTINGCTSDSSLVNAVQIKPKPTQPFITPPANSSVCVGGSITLTASACTGGTLNWTGGLTGNSIVYSTIGTKSFKVACTINGCTSDSSAVQTVTIKPLPIFTITNSKQEICEGESSTLTVSGCTGTLAWSNGAGNVASITVSPTLATTYTATCTQNGCSSSQQATVTPLLSPKVTASGPLVCDQSITLTAQNVPVGTSIQWRKNGVDIVGATGNTLVVNEAGNYDFVVGPEFINLKSTVYDIGNSGIKYFNSNLGYFFHGAFFSKTMDGGNTWNDYDTGFLITKMYFIDANTGWLACDSKILKTIDGGNTWQSSITNFQNKLFLNIIFKNNLVGIATTDANVPYYTVDGGTTWTSNNIAIASRQSFNTISDIKYIPNTNSLIVTANNFSGYGKLISSIDGGVTWSIGSNNFQQLYAINYNSNNQAIIGSIDGIYKTIDGGANWTLINMPINASSPLISLDFVDSNIAYAFQEIRSNFNGKIYKTKDGGTTWKLFRSVFEDDNYLVSNGTMLDFISEDKGWYLFNANTNPQSSSIIKKISTPQCSTIPAVVAPPVSQANSITLTSNKSEICEGESATITSTACNGTLSWSNGAGNVTSIIVTPATTTNYTATCTSGACTKTAQITITPLQTPKVTAPGPLVCGQNVTLIAQNVPVGASIQWRKNGIVISGATGNTLNVSEPGNYDFVVGKVVSTIFDLTVSENARPKIQFLNNKIGFLIMGNQIRKTIDGGSFWSLNYNANVGSLNDVFFLDSNFGWAIALNKLYKTTDGGNNWTIMNNSYNFLKVEFKTNLIGTALTGTDAYFTVDGGLNWTISNGFLGSNGNSSLKIIPNSNIVYATSINGIYKSNNNGVNWNKISNIESIYSAYFFNSTTGFIGGYSELYKTIDGGSTWSRIDLSQLNLNGIVLDIKFVNSQVGYILNQNNSHSIFKTKDGGGTWKLFEFDSFSNQNAILGYGMDFFSEDNGGYLTNWTNAINNFSMFKKFSVPQCPTTPAIVTPIPRPGGALVINTFKSGPWTDASTWACGFIPSSLDEVIINAGHIITDTGNTLNAKKLIFNGNGTLQLAPTTNLKLNN